MTILTFYFRKIFIMNKTKRHHIPILLIVLVLSFLIRILYSCYQTGVVITADSHTYYLAGMGMLKTGILSHNSRPPLYPLFLQMPLLAMGKFEVSVLSPEFMQSARIITIFQSLLGIISLYLLYRIARKIGIGVTAASIFVLFTGFDIMLFMQEQALLADNIAVFLMISFAFTVMNILEKPAILGFIMLFVLFLASMMLKPLYLALPLVIIPVIVFFRSDNPFVYLCSFVIMVVLFACTFFYIQSNEKYFNYSGFSLIGDVHLLGQILYFNLPIDSAKDSYFYDHILNWRKADNKPLPFRFIDYYEPSIYTKADGFKELRYFNNKVILSNLGQYVIKTLKLIPRAINGTNRLYLLSSKNPVPYLTIVFEFLFKFYTFVQYLNYISLPAYFFFCIFILGIPFTKTKSKLRCLSPSSKYQFLFIIATIAMFHIFSTIPFVYYDFGRLLSPARPFLFLFTFSSIVFLISKVKKYCCDYTQIGF